MSRQPKSGRIARSSTLFLTGATKTVGLVSAGHQLLFLPSPHSLPLIVSAFMMAGAQFSEGLLLNILDRIFIDRRDEDKR